MALQLNNIEELINPKEPTEDIITTFFHRQYRGFSNIYEQILDNNSISGIIPNNTTSAVIEKEKYHQVENVKIKK
jgi:hypothetical protein